MGDFSSLNVALTALHAQQKGLDITGQNISNANTEGYSRQRVEMQAVEGQTTPSLWSRADGAGSGVSITGISRARDQFLELRGLQEHASNTNLTRTQSVLGRVELLFAEPGDNGLQAAMSDY